MKDTLAAIRRADDEREKKEVAALIAQLTPEETNRIIERMRALLNEQREKTGGCRMRESRAYMKAERI